MFEQHQIMDWLINTRRDPDLAAVRKWWANNNDGQDFSWPMNRDDVLAQYRAYMEVSMFQESIPGLLEKGESAFKIFLEIEEEESTLVTVASNDDNGGGMPTWVWLVGGGISLLAMYFFG